MAENGKFLKISKDNLKEILDFQAKSLVGRALKRFELHESKDAIKTEVKELIYESFRDIVNLVQAYDSGLHITQFQFKERKVPSAQTQ